MGSIDVNKRILVFVDWYAPGFKAGGPIRSCVNFANSMSSDREVFVFTTDRDLGESDPYPDIESDKWIEQERIKVLYATPPYLNWRNVRQIVNEIAPDYIYINSMYSRYFTLYPILVKRLGLTEAVIILAPRGMLKKSALQFKVIKKKIFLFIFRLLGIHKRIVFHATDDTEVNDVKRIFGGKTRYSQISNLPSFERFGIRDIKKEGGELRLIFVGRIHPIKNLDLLLGYIKRLQSKILFTIVGTVDDEGYWDKCCHIIESLPENIQVVFKENVPNSEIRNLIAAHHIFALPTAGENFGHAIFEALSIGRPVLISDQTPWKGLEQVKAGWDLSLGDPYLFVDTLRQIVEMDDDAYQLWSKGAWQLANDYITKSDLKDQYLKLFS